MLTDVFGMVNLAHVIDAAADAGSGYSLRAEADMYWAILMIRLD